MSSNALRYTKEIERQQRLARAQRDLFWLATEVLGYDLLTADYHKPMMDDMDAQRADYLRRVRLRRPVLNYLELWPRDYYKTTVGIAQAVQDYLVDPGWTNTWWHAVEDMAQEAAAACGRHFMRCDELRSLMPPEMVPAKQNKKFVTTTGRFNFKSNKDKAPSMRAWGVGSEATGGHSKGGILDDPIGLNTIEDSGMPKVRRWLGLTVRNVIRTDVGWKRSKATRWDLNDIYADWLKSKYWQVRTRACYETDGVPDWQGQPMLYTRDQIEAKRGEMSKFEFSCQMMNDPLPDEDRLWDQSKEQTCTLKEAGGPGTVFVLSDPAPAGLGSESADGEKWRGDGSKDEWTYAVVRLRPKGQWIEGIVLDIAGSRDWGFSEGVQRLLQACQRWATPYLWIEYISAEQRWRYSNEVKEQAKAMGVRVYTQYERNTHLLPEFSSSGARAAGAKNARFELLCDWNRDGRIYFADSCKAGELDQAMEQCRNWRVHLKRNTLPYDDRADVLSRMCDPVLQQYVARVLPQTFDPFGDDDDDREEFFYRSRYCTI